jgi:hypothetical protein
MRGVLPEDVVKAMRMTKEEYVRMHEMNSHNFPVKGCKLGTVFMNGPEYYVYVGVNGRNRKYPLIAVRTSDWTRRKMAMKFFDVVRQAV